MTNRRDKKITGQLYSSKNDLRSEPLANSGEIWFTDDSSFITSVVRRAEYTVAPLLSTVETAAFPPGT